MNRKPYIRKIPTTTWYLSKRHDTSHMVQEVSSLFIGLYALLLLWGLGTLVAGPDAFQAFLDGLSHPLSLAFHWVVLVITLLHAMAWFNMAPKAMAVQIGEKFVPAVVISAGHYVAWIVISLFILFIAGVFNGG